jgi:putative oxidoreductase
MAAAYFMVHFPKGFWPIQNRGELAVVYYFLFLYMAARGSGIWSIDTLLQRAQRSARRTSPGSELFGAQSNSPPA